MWSTFFNPRYITVLGPQSLACNSNSDHSVLETILQDAPPKFHAKHVLPRQDGVLWTLNIEKERKKVQRKNGADSIPCNPRKKPNRRNTQRYTYEHKKLFKWKKGQISDNCYMTGMRYKNSSRKTKIQTECGIIRAKTHKRALKVIFPIREEQGGSDVWSWQKKQVGKTPLFLLCFCLL